MLPAAAGDRLLTTGCRGAGGSDVQAELSSNNSPGSRIRLFFRISLQLRQHTTVSGCTDILASLRGLDVSGNLQPETLSACCVQLR